MSEEVKGELIPMPGHIAALFRQAADATDTWAAINRLRKNLHLAEHHSTHRANQLLDGLANHVRVHANLFPPLLDYALTRSILNDSGQVEIMLFENGYQPERFDEEIGKLEYEIAIMGRPAYIYWKGQVYRLEESRPDFHIREIQPQPARLMDTPTVSVQSTDVHLRVKRWGMAITTPNLWIANADSFIQEFAYHLEQAIKSGEAYEVIE